MSLQGKAALVTGGARRLGRAIALALGRAGMRVAIHYHASASSAEDVLLEMRACGAQCIAIPGDLSRVTDCERVVDTTLEQWGGLDLLVNNAGIWGPTPIGNVTEERWDELLNTNLRSMFFVAQRAAPALRASQGAIINIADVGVERPWRNHTPYLVSKGGVVTLTRALAKDLAPEVRVNAIAPGPVLLPDDWSVEQKEQVARTTLLQRIGTPEDIAGAVLFLAQSGYVTGVTLPVDGGYLLR
ncbi:MAG: SDR family oxidoreductase [Roseiflexus sp.]